MCCFLAGVTNVVMAYSMTIDLPALFQNCVGETRHSFIWPTEIRIVGVSALCEHTAITNPKRKYLFIGVVVYLVWDR